MLVHLVTALRGSGRTTVHRDVPLSRGQIACHAADSRHTSPFCGLNETSYPSTSAFMAIWREHSTGVARSSKLQCGHKCLFHFCPHATFFPQQTDKPNNASTQEKISLSVPPCSQKQANSIPVRPHSADPFHRGKRSWKGPRRSGRPGETLQLSPQRC